MSRKSPLHEKHLARGAKFTEFEGWELPVQFTSIIEEHLNTRNNVSLFDISHMGELIIEGKDAHDFLQYVVTNDVDLIKPGGAQYSPVCKEDGTVVDDVFYYCYSREKYRMIVNAGNRQKDLAWFRQHATRFQDVRIVDVSDERGRLALQGPKAQDVLELAGVDGLDGVTRFSFLEHPVNGIDCFIARTGYTGEDGFEISCPVEQVGTLWDILLEAGEPCHIMPAGLGARDTLRLEAAYSLYGHEISEEITPIEGGVEFVVKPSKKADYIGRAVLEKQLRTFIDRKIIAIKGLGKGIFRHGQPVYDASGKIKIGTVTSGSFSPTFGIPIALALVDSKFKHIGDKVMVQVRNRLVPGEIVNRPFYPYHPRPRARTGCQ